MLSLCLQGLGHYKAHLCLAVSHHAACVQSAWCTRTSHAHAHHKLKLTAVLSATCSGNSPCGHLDDVDTIKCPDEYSTNKLFPWNTDTLIWWFMCLKYFPSRYSHHTAVSLQFAIVLGWLSPYFCRLPWLQYSEGSNNLEYKRDGSGGVVSVMGSIEQVSPGGAGGCPHHLPFLFHSLAHLPPPYNWTAWPVWAVLPTQEFLS